MQWENLTSADFARAVEECHHVGLIGIGVLEAHGSHLPLGTDMFEAHHVCCQAAARESAIVFPAYPYGINHETAHLPGGMVLKRELVFSLLENICEEMARNGLHKIVIISGHGGNRFFIPLFVQTLLEKERNYTVYYGNVDHFCDGVLESGEFGHACEAETSTALHIYPELVKMNQLPPERFHNLGRHRHVADKGGYSPVDWYAQYPAMFVGEPGLATAEKGRAMTELRINGIVEILKAVKADKTTPALQKQFLEGKKAPSPAAEWAIPPVSEVK